MVKRFTKRILAQLGFEVRRTQSDTLERFRAGTDGFVDQREILAGTQAAVIFDVGAHHGQTTARYREIFPAASVLAFEPFPEAFAILRKRFSSDHLVTLVGMALSELDGQAAFFSNRADYTNSLLPPDPRATPWVPAETTASLSQIEVRTRSLDSFCSEHQIERISILKTDVQGAEVQLLQGASRMLKGHRIDLLYLEVLFAPLYQAQAAFCDLLDFLGPKGYRLVGLYDLHRGNNGFAGWADALFVRDDFPIPDGFKGHHGVT